MYHEPLEVWLELCPRPVVLYHDENDRVDDARQDQLYMKAHLHRTERHSLGSSFKSSLILKNLNTPRNSGRGKCAEQASARQRQVGTPSLSSRLADKLDSLEFEP